jgi:DNA primase
MLRQSQLISLLDRALNQTARIRKGNEAVYYCPFCHHHKKKMEINVDTERWNCWVCHTSGLSIRSLFFKVRVGDSYLSELYKITNSYPRANFDEDKPEFEEIPVLPADFIPLSIPSKSFKYHHALKYLRERNVTREDILRYNLGYCENGEYRSRIVIPSYDKNGAVNFFSARAFYDNNMKYMLPPWSKDIIGFELFINWQEPITIVEGGFDAMAIRNNVIPLFGTSMPFSLKLALVENKTKRVNIVLDKDALQQAVDIYERIEDLQSEKIDIHLIVLGEKDPSVLGFEKVHEIIESSKPFDFGDLMKLKLNLI